MGVATPIQVSARTELTERERSRITNGLPTSASRGPHARVVLSTMVQRKKFNGGAQNILQGNSAGIVTGVLPPWIAASVALTFAHRSRKMSESDDGSLVLLGHLLPVQRQ